MSITRATLRLHDSDDIIAARYQSMPELHYIRIGDTVIEGSAIAMRALSVAIVRALDAPGLAQGRAMQPFIYQGDKP